VRVEKAPLIFVTSVYFAFFIKRAMVRLTKFINAITNIKAAIIASPITYCMSVFCPISLSNPDFK